MASIIRNVFHEFDLPKENTVFTDTSTDNLAELFTVARSAYWVAECNGTLTGGGGYFPTEGLPHTCAELVKLYLLPEWRGRGLGREFMNLIIHSAREDGYRSLYLESFPGFVQALKLYETNGFTRIESPMGRSGHTACNVWMHKEL